MVSEKTKALQKAGMPDSGKELLDAQKFLFPTGEIATMHVPAFLSGCVWPME